MSTGPKPLSLHEWRLFPLAWAERYRWQLAHTLAFDLMEIEAGPTRDEVMGAIVGSWVVAALERDVVVVAQA